MLPNIFFALLGLPFLLSHPLLAQTPSIPEGSRALLTIEQEGPGGIIGTWELVSPGNKRKEGGGTLTLLPLEQTGMYFLSALPPEGGASTIDVYSGDELIQRVQRPQASFRIEEGQSLRVHITHTFVHTGTVSVHSDPAGISFTVKGPNHVSLTGITPATFQKSPEGQYAVYFEALEGCRPPQPKSLFLSRSSRISLSVTLDCDQATQMRKKILEEENPFLSVTVDGEKVTYTDIPKDAWFATYISSAVRIGILSGYRSISGKLTGEFGPGNPVTVGEFAKIAHRLIGLDEMTRPTAAPENEAARDQWFSPFIASAEEQGWTIFNDATIDPLRPITRAEVVVTILQLFSIPLEWAQGGIFNDVTRRTRFAAAVETAAKDGLISGRTDAEGKGTGSFGPEDPINRAEMAKLIKVTLETYKRSESAPLSLPTP